MKYIIQITKIKAWFQISSAKIIRVGPLVHCSLAFELAFTIGVQNNQILPLLWLEYQGQEEESNWWVFIFHYLLPKNILKIWSGNIKEGDNKLQA